MAVSGSGVKTDALRNYGTNAATAAGALGTVNPIYSSMATNPTGYTPQQKSNLLTASEQTEGGGVSAATGQGGLYAARTGNAGGAAAAIDDASRQAGVQQSENALGVENQDAQLADSHQREGLAGLSGIYANANGQANQSLQVANGAQPSFLKQIANTALGDLRYSPGQK